MIKPLKTPRRLPPIINGIPQLAVRPWHVVGVQAQLADIADHIHELPLVRNLIPGDIVIKVEASASGVGLVFTVEPAP